MFKGRFATILALFGNIDFAIRVFIVAIIKSFGPITVMFPIFLLFLARFYHIVPNGF